MVSMGEFSKELCGGTHLDNTGQVGLFKIVGEESVSAGTRRITALTGPAALARSAASRKRPWPKRPRFSNPRPEVPRRVAALVKELRELKKHSARAAEPAKSRPKSFWPRPRTSGASASSWPKSRAARRRPDAATDRSVAQQGQCQSPCCWAAAKRTKSRSWPASAAISKPSGVDAGQWIRAAAEVVGGRGGGKPDMAQAGGKHPEKLPAALEKARQAIYEQLAHAG